MIHLSGDLTRLVLLANVVAWPAAWYFLQRWLRGFLYRAPLRFDIFVAAGVIAAAIALVTISFQSVRAARADPVKSLRHE